jgi:alpha-glucosidase
MGGSRAERTLPDWARADDAAAAPHRWHARGTGRDVRVWLLADGVVRLRYAPPGADPPDRSFALVTPASDLPGAEVRAAAAEDGAALVLATDALTVTVRREGARVRIADAAGRLLLEDRPDPAASGTTVVRHTPRGEPFLGLGEKTGRLDRRGRRLAFWNTDAFDPALGGYPADQDPLYLSVPFFLGVRRGVAYGLFVDDPHWLEMDLAARADDTYRIVTEGPALDQYLLLGPSPADVLRRYTRLTGRAPLPPRWALGYHQSRWGYRDAARLEAVADELRDRDLPADALWLDIQHMRGCRDFTFDPETFPDPEGLAARLADRGFRLVAIADPGIGVDPGWALYERARSGGHLLRRPDGSIYEGRSWPGRSVFLDFTAEGARRLWAREIARWVARGIDGVWLDLNEPSVQLEEGGQTGLPSELPAAGDGVPTTLAEAHDVYALLQARATWEGLREARPERRPFILTRAGFAGIQRYAAVWTGDAPSDWAHLRQTPAMLMGLGLSGVPFVGSDIGGFSGHASAELYVRWLQLGAFSPFCRTHHIEGVPDQAPWTFGPEVEAICRRWLRERYRLLPYLYALFAEASATGAPVLRPLGWELPDEPALWQVDDQMMLGPWLLVAPVLEPGAARRAVRLPAGRWRALDGRARFEGPATVEVPVTLASVPILVREGAILPRVPPLAHTGEAPRGPLRLDLDPSDRKTAFVLHEDAGDGDGPAARTSYRLRRTPRGARLEIGPREGGFRVPPRELELHVHGLEADDAAVRIDGAPVDAHRRGDAVVVRLRDRARAVVEIHVR